MKRVSRVEVEEFFTAQLAEWQMAADSFAALKQVKMKTVKVGNATFKAQFNPARIHSSAAKVDAASLKARKCFLCDVNRPAEQHSLQWDENYKILVNPYPIFPKHLTVPSCCHTAQSINGRITHMMELAQVLDNYEVFYNGPHCGASAPDHMHFQAGNKGFMTWLDDLKFAVLEQVCCKADATMSIVDGLARASVVIKATTIEGGVSLFEQLLACLPVIDGESEPMLNVLCSFGSGEWTITVFPRKKHRPSCYGTDGDDKILISPASVDMGGVLALPLEKDFEKIGEKEIKTIFNEVCYSADEISSMLQKLK
ncbi:MAG: DUF4922 domain-containing protein [Muribaculaceae bacterium]